MIFFHRKMIFFVLKALFVFKNLNFCPETFGHVGKELDKKVTVNFKIYDVAKYIYT